MIEDYFLKIERIISGFRLTKSCSFTRHIINKSFGVIKGVISFENGTLDFLEVVRISDDGKPFKKKYKYNLRDNNNQLVFRYDNVPHFPTISTFPHHKHSEKEVLESKEPDLFEVLIEIAKSLS